MNFFISNIKYIEVDPMSDEEFPAWNIEDAEGKHFIAQLIENDVDLYEVDPNTGENRRL